MYEPKVIAFFCRWCTYAAADLAGITRMRYPPNVLPIRVPCSGRVDPRVVLEAFLQGADGVLIGGCHTPSDCHYLVGNFKAFKRVLLLKKLLKQVGLEPERVRLEWISATESSKLVKTIKEFVEELRKLGPKGGEKGEA